MMIIVMTMIIVVVILITIIAQVRWSFRSGLDWKSPQDSWRSITIITIATIIITITIITIITIVFITRQAVLFVSQTPRRNMGTSFWLAKESWAISLWTRLVSAIYLQNCCKHNMRMKQMFLTKRKHEYIQLAKAGRSACELCPSPQLSAKPLQTYYAQKNREGTRLWTVRKKARKRFPARENFPGDQPVNPARLRDSLQNRCTNNVRRKTETYVFV